MFCLYKAERPVFEVAIKEDYVIHVYPATMSMAQKLQNINTAEIDIVGLYGLVADLLSHNKEKAKITVEDIEVFDVNIITALVVEFGDFMKRIKNDPN